MLVKSGLHTIISFLLQISDYFTQLPGFPKEQAEEEAEWVPPPNNLSNGGSTSEPNIGTSTRPDISTEEHLQ